MIHSVPIHTAYCDWCMKSSEVESDTIANLLRLLKAKGWLFDECKGYCQDLMLCAECKEKKCPTS